jgi:hypothetical protein
MMAIEIRNSTPLRSSGGTGNAVSRVLDNRPECHVEQQRDQQKESNHQHQGE